MAESLILRLPQVPDEQATWLVVDTQGNATGPPQGGPLQLAAARCGGRRVCVLVPGTEVLLAEPEVPAPRGAKLAQLVPYAMEEQLAEDLETLHFAIGRRVGGSAKVPVAVVARSLMDEWLASLSEAGIHPDLIAVDAELLPQDPGHASALLEDTSVVVRPPQGLPLTLPITALTEALESVQSPEELTAGGVRGLNVYATAAQWEAHQAEVESLAARFDGIKIHLLPGTPLALLAQSLPHATPINLLQGPYAPANANRGGFRPWRVAALLLAGLIGLHVAGRAAELSLLKRHEQQLDSQIRDTFRNAMQAEPSGDDARHQMERRLALARGINTGLLAALEAMVQARGSVPGAVEVKSLGYHAGVIDMKIGAPDAATLDHLATTLRSSGWQAQLQGGNHQGQGYEGRIQIHTGG